MSTPYPTLPGRREHPSVLIAEDDADARNALNLLLIDEGYQTATAANGREALQRLEAAVPDVVVLDLRMPVLDGFGFLAEARKNSRWARIPVVITSANMECDKEGLGAFAYVRKPIDVDELLMLVQQAAAQAYSR